MTPLAHQLAKQLVSPVKDRHPFWRDNSDNLRDMLSNTHFFECTEVLPLMETVQETSQEWFDERTFLPAPRTWVEFENPLGKCAVHMEDTGQGWARCSIIWPDCACYAGLASYNGDYNVPGTDVAGMYAVPDRIREQFGHEHIKRLREAFISAAHCLLVIINSPHIIGRTTRVPHRGLERELRKKFPVFGKYPLHAWSELKLEANVRQKDEHTGEVHEAHLTGKKCLHFCRAHLRVRLGKLELVSSHWRGDPALGIKRTRYKIIPPKRRPTR